MINSGQDRVPDDILLRQKPRLLSLSYHDKIFYLPCACLRYHSPATQVPASSSKDAVVINSIELAESNGIVLSFSDGYTSEIYSWERLFQLVMKFAS